MQVLPERAYDGSQSVHVVVDAQGQLAPAGASMASMQMSSVLDALSGSELLAPALAAALPWAAAKFGQQQRFRSASLCLLRAAVWSLLAVPAGTATCQVEGALLVTLLCS